MKCTAPRSTSAFADNKLFLSAVILSVLAAVLGIILADANVAVAALQVLPARLNHEKTDRVVTDTWIDTQVKEIAAKFKNARNAGPSTFVVAAK
jgi:hypothetical protein